MSKGRLFNYLIFILLFLFLPALSAFLPRLITPLLAKISKVFSKVSRKTPGVNLWVEGCMLKVPSKAIREMVGKEAVLIVEPSGNYKNSLKGFFANLKITNLKFVSTAKEARSALLSLKVSLFVVEWDLKGENGIQFCRSLRKRQEPGQKATPFLLMTVENKKTDVILASEVGIDGYLLKPFSYEDFATALNNLAINHQKPNHLTRLLEKAEKLYEEQDLDGALSAFKDAEESNPASARAIAGIGRTKAAQNLFDDAIACYRKAIDFNPEYLTAYRELLELLDLRGTPTELRDLAEKVNSLSPGNPKYTMILAKAELTLGNTEKSEDYYKKTIRLSPRLAEAYKGLGTIYNIKKDYELAMKNFSKALDIDNNDISCLNSLGLTYVKMEKYEQGIEKYRAALKVKPNDPRILFNLGYAMEKTERIERAINYYQLAVTHKPDFTKAARRLDLLKSKMKKSS